MMGLAFDGNQTSIEHRFQLTLQRSKVDLMAWGLEILHRRAAALQTAARGLGLPIIPAVIRLVIVKLGLNPFVVP